MMKWFKKIELCFTDTDSLLYRIEGQDVYKVMKEHSDMFDFSDYPYDHFCYDKKNKKKSWANLRMNFFHYVWKNLLV